jgi:hypothetical protein
MIQTLTHAQTHCHCPFAIMVWNKDKLVGILWILITGGGGWRERERKAKGVSVQSPFCSCCQWNRSLLSTQDRNAVQLVKAVMRRQHRPQEHHITSSSPLWYQHHLPASPVVFPGAATTIVGGRGTATLPARREEARSVQFALERHSIRSKEIPVWNGGSEFYMWNISGRWFSIF